MGDLIREKRWAPATRRWHLVRPRRGTCFPLLSEAHLRSCSRPVGPNCGAGVKSSFSFLLVLAEGTGRSQKRGRFRLQLSSNSANELFIALVCLSLMFKCSKVSPNLTDWNGGLPTSLCIFSTLALGTFPPSPCIYEPWLSITLAAAPLLGAVKVPVCGREGLF